MESIINPSKPHWKIKKENGSWTLYLKFGYGTYSPQCHSTNVESLWRFLSKQGLDENRVVVCTE